MREPVGTECLGECPTVLKKVVPRDFYRNSHGGASLSRCPCPSPPGKLGSIPGYLPRSCCSSSNCMHGASQSLLGVAALHFAGSCFLQCVKLSGSNLFFES